MRLRVTFASLALVCTFAGTAAAGTMGDPDVAALQVALRARGLYLADIDGWYGPKTAAALRAVPGGRAALDPRDLGSRILRKGMSGWDVAELQFLLAWHGFPSGTFDGVFGDHVQAAVLAFQDWAGVPTTGRAGPLTLAALRTPLPRSPLKLLAPVPGPVGDLFGPRDDRFHAGIDIPAPAGAFVSAAASGVVVYAGWKDGGFGNTVEIDHGGGLHSLYFHLQRVDVSLGEAVSAGERVGLVGSTGESTGPHLHFELHLWGAAVDPLTALT
jgi:murein DD-endopeptidase MepM/ murein hydrolase activator NlpD